MPIYKQNTKVGEVIDTLKDVGERYHDKLVFQHKYPVGAVLATIGLPIEVASYGILTGSWDGTKHADWFTQKNTYPLDISKIKTGIKIAGSLTVLSDWNPRDGGGMTTLEKSTQPWTDSPVSITKAQLQSGSTFQIAKLNNGWPVSGKFDGTNLIITGGLPVTASSNLVEEHSGAVDGTSHVWTYLTISNITAY